MATQRHKISLRVLKNISKVSAPFELFYDEFKVTKLYKNALQRRFVFVEYCCHALREFLKSSLRFWIIHE